MLISMPFWFFFWGAFLDFCWCILGFFCIFLAYVFPGHTSDNVAARAKIKCSFRIVWSFHGVIMRIFMPFWIFWGHFGTVFGGFGDFLPFFLVKCFSLSNVLYCGWRTTKCSFRIFCRFRGLLCSFSCHYGSFGGIFGLLLAYFRIFLPFFLVKFFFVKRPILWLRGQKQCSFRISLSL